MERPVPDEYWLKELEERPLFWGCSSSYILFEAALLFVLGLFFLLLSYGCHRWLGIRAPRRRRTVETTPLLFAFPALTTAKRREAKASALLLNPQGFMDIEFKLLHQNHFVLPVKVPKKRRFVDQRQIVEWAARIADGSAVCAQLVPADRRLSKVNIEFGDVEVWLAEDD